MENKKIKSVKLAKDYRTAIKEILKGQQLYYYNHYWSDAYNVFEKGNVSFHESEVSENKTGLFEIEYYNEHFEYHEKLYSADKNFVDAVINADNLKNKNFLNALADWCDEKFIIKGFKPTKLENPCVITYNQFSDALEWAYKIINRHSGNLVLNSNESAQLFIAELNRNENKAVKEYFINLLKSERLR